MLAGLITRTSDRRNEIIDRQKGNICIVVLPIMDVKTCWNSTLELLEQAYQLQEFTASGSRDQHTVITSHSSQHMMNGPLSITSWKC